MLEFSEAAGGDSGHVRIAGRLFPLACTSAAALVYSERSTCAIVGGMMRRTQLIAICLFAFIGRLLPASEISNKDAVRPNIVWIVVDDMSPNFSCYGETAIETPHVDRLAKEGVLFRQAFVTCPVCSPCRSALITGMYQTTIGAHHHRSGRGAEKIHLPDGIQPVPMLFQRAGYYTCISSWPLGEQLGKTDYNFEWAPSMYDGSDWSGRKEGQPFFAQIQLHGGKYREGKGWRKTVEKTLGSVTPASAVKLPPYYPADDVLLDDWARYLDSVRYTDWQVGQVVARLEKEQLLDSTVVFFITDHGISHARGKQFLYEEGIRIPFVVRGPRLPRGESRDDLVLQIDLAAASLGFAGISLPDRMQARDIFAKNYRPREFVISARDRCDETVDRIRSLRNAEFKYIRNFYPQRPYLQPNAYKDNKQIVKAIRRLAAEGKLEGPQKLVVAESRAPEELYDLSSDPFEAHNLANEPAYGESLAKLRSQLNAWIRESGDRGETPESEAMYNSDMAVYLNSKREQPNRLTEQERNIELMKRWAAEGK